MKSSEYQINKFVEYIRTKQFMLNAIKGVDPNTFVFISMNEIKSRFLVNPHEDIKSLVEAGEIEVKKSKSAKGYIFYSYKVLKAGYYDLNLTEPKGKELTYTTERMMNILKDVSLKKDSPSTQYFNSFLEHKNQLLRIFFNVDEFSGRVHSPVTSFKSEYRHNILIDGKETTSLDVVTMQPVLLGEILKKTIGENDFSSWINEGRDIYLMLQSKANLKSRDVAKKRFFEILFSRPNYSLKNMFGNSNWITWINEIKNKPFNENPHTLEKNHSNLAYILQISEVNIMTEVWCNLLDNEIKFISVHDEIIIKQSDNYKAKEIFSHVLSKYLSYFRLSDKLSSDKKQANNSEVKAEKKLLNEGIVNGVQSRPIKGKLYYRYELKNEFNLTDKAIDLQFEDCFAGALWIPFYEFQSNRSLDLKKN